VRYKQKGGFIDNCGNVRNVLATRNEPPSLKFQATPNVESSSVVSRLARLSLDHSLAGLNSAESDGILTEIKIRSTSSFEVEVKPSVPRRKILWHVKDPFQV
jgi:hypothetical protein